MVDMGTYYEIRTSELPAAHMETQLNFGEYAQKLHFVYEDYDGVEESW